MGLWPPPAPVPAPSRSGPELPPRHLDRRVVRLWVLRGQLRNAGGAAVTLLVAAVLGVWWPTVRAVLMVATAALLLVTVATEPWYQRRRYRAFTYRLGADALEIAQGVWWKRRLVLPYHRLQRVDLHQGPLERWRGLTALRLHTASPATDAVLPGVSEADAAVLRAALLDRAGRDDGV